MGRLLVNLNLCPFRPGRRIAQVALILSVLADSAGSCKIECDARRFVNRPVKCCDRPSLTAAGFRYVRTNLANSWPPYLMFNGLPGSSSVNSRAIRYQASSGK